MAITPPQTSPEITTIDPHEVRRRMENGETFVVNVVAAWCPDCIDRQLPCLPNFITRLQEHDIPFCQVIVQRERLVFLSGEHERLTELFGGQGYPRTVLIINGVAEEHAPVEIMTPLALDILASSIIKRVKNNPQ